MTNSIGGAFAGGLLLGICWTACAQDPVPAKNQLPIPLNGLKPDEIAVTVPLKRMSPRLVAEWLQPCAREYGGTLDIAPIEALHCLVLTGTRQEVEVVQKIAMQMDGTRAVDLEVTSVRMDPGHLEDLGVSCFAYKAALDENPPRYGNHLTIGVMGKSFSARLKSLTVTGKAVILEHTTLHGWSDRTFGMLQSTEHYNLVGGPMGYAASPITWYRLHVTPVANNDDTITLYFSPQVSPPSQSYPNPYLGKSKSEKPGIVWQTATDVILNLREGETGIYLNLFLSREPWASAPRPTGGDLFLFITPTIVRNWGAGTTN